MVTPDARIFSCMVAQTRGPIDLRSVFSLFFSTRTLITSISTTAISKYKSRKKPLAEL